MFRNKNVYILNFGKVSTTNQTKRNQRDARTTEGDARSLYGMRCADLCGLVVFARCAARSLYCAMRCAVVARDAMRGLVAFARCSCKRRQRHAFDGGILRVDFLGSVQH
jgi:hypothetical protein